MTYRNRNLLGAVRELECVKCGAHGVQAAHANLQEFGKGMGTKASDAAIMSLCPSCHAALDQGKDMTKDERRAMQFECITRTYVRLMERGFIEVTK